MLLTSPLVVTVGLSLSIPLALAGQKIVKGQSSSAAYWLGAGLTFAAFLLVNQANNGEEISEDDGLTRTSGEIPRQEGHHETEVDLRAHGRISSTIDIRP